MELAGESCVERRFLTNFAKLYEVSRESAHQEPCSRCRKRALQAMSAKADYNRYQMMHLKSDVPAVC